MKPVERFIVHLTNDELKVMDDAGTEEYATMPLVSPLRHFISREISGA